MGLFEKIKTKHLYMNKTYLIIGAVEKHSKIENGDLR